jgi:hypothetical protein
MRLSRTILLAALSITTACGSDILLTAQDELLLSAISGEEDYLGGAETVSGGSEAPAQGGAEADRAEGDRQGTPPMFRECDAAGTYTGLFSAYDEDADGELGAPEQDEVMSEHAGPDQGPRGQLLGMLRVVYDVDADGQFSDAERATLLEDFTARCEAIHEAVLAEFDADGDGELNDAEQEAARDAHQERMEAAREDMEDCREAMGMDECDGGEGGGGGGERGDGPPPEGAEGEGERGDGPPPIRGPLADEFDADGDGELSESELDTLRTELRARIRSGEAPHGDCPVDSE